MLFSSTFCFTFADSQVTFSLLYSFCLSSIPRHKEAEFGERERIENKGNNHQRLWFRFWPLGPLANFQSSWFSVSVRSNCFYIVARKQVTATGTRGKRKWMPASLIPYLSLWFPMPDHLFFYCSVPFCSVPVADSKSKKNKTTRKESHYKCIWFPSWPLIATLNPLLNAVLCSPILFRTPSEAGRIINENDEKKRWKEITIARAFNFLFSCLWGAPILSLLKSNIPIHSHYVYSKVRQNMFQGKKKTKRAITHVFPLFLATFSTLYIVSVASYH